MSRLTRDQAEALAAHLLRKFHGRRVRKSDAVEMQVLAAVFDAARALGAEVPSGADFMGRFATTLGPLVYLPEVDDPDALAELIAHEVQHVVQFWQGTHAGPNAFGMAWLYLAEPEMRARYEVDAIRPMLEVRFWLTGALPSLEDLAGSLDGHYALGSAEGILVRQLLESAATSVAAGQVRSAAGVEAVAWLERFAPDARAVRA